MALTHLYWSDGICSNAVFSGIIKEDVEGHYGQHLKKHTVCYSDGNVTQKVIIDDEIKKGIFDPETSPFAGILKTPQQGASTTVWAAVAPELENIGGAYLENCGFSKQMSPAEIPVKLYGYATFAVNNENALKLWDISMKLIKNPPAKNTITEQLV